MLHVFQCKSTVLIQQISDGKSKRMLKPVFRQEKYTALFNSEFVSSN